MRVANGEPASGKRSSPATRNRGSGGSFAAAFGFFDSGNNINDRAGGSNANETSHHHHPLLDAAVSSAETDYSTAGVSRNRTGSPKKSNSFVEQDARLTRTPSTVDTATDNSARLREIPQEHVGHKPHQFQSHHHRSTHDSVDNNDFTTTYGDRSASTTQIQKQQQEGVTQHSYNNHLIASSTTTISYPPNATANLSRGREEIVEEQFPFSVTGGSTVQDGLLPPSLPNVNATTHTPPHTSRNINQQQRTISPLRERDRRSNSNMGYNTQPADCFFPNSNTDSVGNNDHSSEDKMEEKTERSFSTT